MYIVFLLIYEDGYILRDRVFFDSFVKALNFATTQFGYSYMIYKDHSWNSDKIGLVARSWCEGIIA